MGMASSRRYGMQEIIPIKIIENTSFYDSKYNAVSVQYENLNDFDVEISIEVSYNNEADFILLKKEVMIPNSITSSYLWTLTEDKPTHIRIQVVKTGKYSEIRVIV
ncbi:hypothetical protein LNI98_07200 [Tenacibaculum dicentrarchi]|uniref:hypothetical protein n=1 Tax=Tenacibaculum dicentrarchi TaxID=669041 RepID=UPI001E522EA6|nr:hypothetical protein [Tenacibaculum dicentrarchi]